MKNLKKVLLTGTLTVVVLLTISTYTNAATVKITGEVVNIRKEASTESSVVARLSEDVECEYIGEKGNWYQIKYKNYTGYVSKDYAKLQGKVSNNQSNSNTTNTQNNITTQNTNGNQNNSTQTNNEQTNQTTNSQSNAETNNQADNEGDTTQTSSTQPVNKKLKQNSTIKILPLVHASDIGNAKTSDTVLILTETAGWSYIQTDEISGWVRTTSLEDAKTTTQVNSKPADSSTSQKEDNKTEKVGYISEEEVNMRKGAGTSYSIIKTLKLNAQVTILGEQGKWYKVKSGNDTGYISKDYVSDTAKITNRSLTDSRSSKESAENKKEETTTTATKTANKTTTTNSNKNIISNNTTSSSIKGTDVVAYAKKYLGHKYVWGGDGSNGTFDCSGFTMYVYKHFGVSLPHYTVSQYNSGKGKKITKQSDLKMGDIVYLTDYVTGAPCGHCGIYISDGKFIHADSTVMKVNISDLNGMYKGRFCGALRIIQ
ncbi:MAG: SH3 domain-containing protein [Clostridia bacterium]|jgi:cell wall-associated NlpC family hydrolase|nr:SH3 domain-containing protein [Clostridia bacterium]